MLSGGIERYEINRAPPKESEIISTVQTIESQKPFEIAKSCVAILLDPIRKLSCHIGDAEVF